MLVLRWYWWRTEEMETMSTSMPGSPAEASVDFQCKWRSIHYDSIRTKLLSSTPYAGIPRSCQICTNDVLEHQILHLIVHLNCKFCRQEFRPFEYRSIVNIYDFKMAEVELRKEEESTCPSFLKVCFDIKSRKRHEKRSHGSHTCTDFYE